MRTRGQVNQDIMKARQELRKAKQAYQQDNAFENQMIEMQNTLQQLKQERASMEAERRGIEVSNLVTKKDKSFFETQKELQMQRDANARAERLKKEAEARARIIADTEAHHTKELALLRHEDELEALRMTRRYELEEIENQYMQIQKTKAELNRPINPLNPIDMSKLKQTDPIRYNREMEKLQEKYPANFLNQGKH